MMSFSNPHWGNENEMHQHPVCPKDYQLDTECRLFLDVETGIYFIKHRKVFVGMENPKGFLCHTGM
jgi:hypothetical protein